ncbi:MAG: amino acid aminotransferase [Steroidobacteraceae bacterium]
MIFSNLERLPPDPILGVTAAYRADPTPGKIDLGVGVYRDERGETPVPGAVREAERAVLADQRTKTYVGPAGNLEFNERLVAMALGPLAAPLAARTATIQTVGGCGALRLGAEIVRASEPDAVVHVSDPTWANHEPLLGTCGLRLDRYPYYDARTHGVDYGRMRDHLARMPAGSVVLLHGCCHNPTGADLSREEWDDLSALVESKSLVPFIDLAYQGFGDDLEADAYGLRRIAERSPQFLLAMSCSKNFGLYRERTGALAVVGSTPSVAAAVATHQARTGRRMYSMPPDHGAAIVARLLGDEGLRARWIAELDTMVARMKSLRALLAGRLEARRPDLDWSWVTRHRGMFSLTGLDAAGVTRLRDEYHVYLPPDGRINFAGVSDGNVDRVAESLVGAAG